MHQYIIDTEFAVQNLLRLATQEETTLNGLIRELSDVEAKLRVSKWDFESSDLNDDFPDAYVMSAFGRMARAAQEADELRVRLAAVQASIGTHQQAIQAIAGSILQVARQGISVVHGGLTAAPDGRSIGSALLKDIIWQGRNQAMHYEEGRFSKQVTDLFAILEREQGGQFSLTAHPNQSRAKQVIHLLGWSDYEAYVKDMQMLLP